MTCLVLPMQHLQPDVPIGARVQAPSTAVPTMLAPNGASKPTTWVLVWVAFCNAFHRGVLLSQ